MNNNFFKKCLVTIAIISLLGLLLLICLYQGTNDIKKERELGKSPTRGQKLDQTPSLHSNHSPEIEPPKLKFKTTQSHFDQVKAYVLSETDDKSLLPNNLSQEEKSEINKKRNELINDFERTKQRWNPRIEKVKEECDDFHLKIQEIKNQFPSLKSQEADFKKTTLKK